MTSNTSSTLNIEFTPIEAINTYLVYNKEFKVVICITCHFALGLKDKVIKHLSKHIKDYKELNNEIIIVEDKVKNLEINKDLDLPINYKYNFKDLTISNGYSCKLCSFLTSHYKALRQHLNKSHTIKHINSGFKTSTLEEYYIKDVKLQTFYSNPKFINYFITSNNTNFSTKDTTIEEDYSNSILNSYKDKAKDIEASSSNIKEGLTTKELSSFLLNTKWHKYFINKDLKVLRSFLDDPKLKSNNDLEDVLGLAYNITLKLIISCEPLLEKLSRRQKQELNTENTSKEIKEMRPFKVVEQTSRLKYNVIFPKLIVYILRIYITRLEDANDINIIQPNIDDLIEPLKALEGLLIQANSFKDKDSSTYNKLEEDIIVQILNVIINLLQQDTKQVSFKDIDLFNSPIITFLILKCFNFTNESFIKEENIQNQCSFLIYNFRLSILGFLKQAYIDATKKEKKFNLDSTFKTYLTLVNYNSNNCFEELTQVRAICRKIANNTNKESNVISFNKDLVSINNKRVFIPTLEIFFKDIIYSLEDILYSKLLFSREQDFNLDLSSIKDDISNISKNFNFTRYISKDQNLEAYNNFIILKLLSKDSLINRTLIKDINSSTNEIKWKEDNIRELYNNRTKFLELLLLAIYLTSGAPIRGTEIVILKYFNTITTSLRNVLIDNKTNLVKIRTTYHKSMNITRQSNNTIRFLSPKLSNILKAYIIFFIPLYKFINIEHYKAKEISPYIFENKGRVYTSERLSSILLKESSKYLDEGLTILDYRHVIIYIIKNAILLDYTSNSENEDLIEDIQANHSTKVSNRVYGREVDLDLSTNVNIEKKSLEFNMKFFKFFKLLEESKVTKHKRQTSSITLPNKKVKEGSIITPTIEEQQLNRTLNLINEDIPLINHLQNYFKDPSSTFRSKEQEDVLNLILDKEPFITYINGTSSGKSLLFLLPSFIDPLKKLFIITPRVSLKEDLYLRAKSKGISCEIYFSFKSISSNVVFLSIEDLEDNSLISYLNKLISNNEEFTFYLDEAHLLVLEEEYRYTLKHITTITKFKQQIVFISATLPNELLKILEKKFNIRNNIVIRGSTSRLNISYNVIKLEGKPLIDVFLPLYYKALSSLKENEKIIIFCPTKAICESISKELNISCYYSNKENKEVILLNFKDNSSNKSIVGTNALGVGIDIRSIRYSFHLYKFTSLINLEQEIGRVGRDNKPSTSYVLVDPFYYTTNPYINDLDPYKQFKVIDYKELAKFSTSNKCLRKTLERFFNNKDFNSCLPPYIPCSICREREESLNYTKDKEIFRAKAIQQTFSSLIDKLDAYKVICPSCFLDSKDNLSLDYNHYLYSCSSFNALLIKEKKKELEDLIKKNKLFSRGSCCFQCFLPSNICLNRNIKDEACKYQGIILEFIILAIELLKGNYIDLETLTIKSKKLTKINLELATYISKKIIYNNKDAILAIKVFLELDLSNVFISSSYKSRSSSKKIEEDFNILTLKSNKPSILDSSSKKIKEDFNILTLKANKPSILDSSYNINISNNSLSRPSSKASSNSTNYDLEGLFKEEDFTSLDISIKDKDNDKLRLTLNKNLETLKEDLINLNNTFRFTFINKISSYINYKCLFCIINPLKKDLLDKDNLHVSSNCPYYSNELKDIKEIYYPTMNNSFKNSNRENLVCSECLLEFRTCHLYREGKRFTNTLYKCIFKLETLIILYIIYYKKQGGIPFHFYLGKNGFKDYLEYITEDASYKELKTSKGHVLIANLSINEDDLALEDYITKEEYKNYYLELEVVEDEISKTKSLLKELL